MSNGAILKQLKEVYYGMYDNNGNVRVTFKGILGQKDISEGRIELLRDILKLVIDTDFCCTFTKIYIKNKDMTAKSVCEYWNELEDERATSIINAMDPDKSEELHSKVVKITMSVDQVAAKIQYDKRRLEAELGSDCINTIIEHPSINVDALHLKVSDLLAEYGNEDSLRDKLCINIRKDCLSKEFNGDFFGKYENILYLMLNTMRDYIEKQLNSDSDFVGYFNFLTSSIECNNDKQIEDRAKLKALLNGELNGELLIENIMKMREVTSEEVRVNSEEVRVNSEEVRVNSEENVEIEEDNVEENIGNDLVDIWDNEESTREEEKVDNENEVDTAANNDNTVNHGIKTTRIQF